MTRHHFWVSVAFILMVLPKGVFANVLINEVFYDASGSDKGSEWLEIYNSGPQAIDLSVYRLAEGGTNHKLKFVQGASVVPALGYAIISNDLSTFKTLYPQFGGNIFESSFSLNNTGETIAIKDAKLVATDEFAYSSALGANGDGDSLQKFPDGWKASKPTPGSANIFVISQPKSTPLPATSKGASSPSKKTTVAKPATSAGKQTASAVSSGASGDGFFKWMIVLGGVLVAGALAFFFTPKPKKTEADGIEIVE